MQSITNRRRFLKYSLSIPLILPMGMAIGKEEKNAIPASGEERSPKIKLSCNLYSFNDPLLSGEMTLEQVIDFCAELGFDAIDPTGYYFPSYPESPEDAYLYHIKRKAFLQGLDISGTGVRNDFTVADKGKREADVVLVKRWVEVAAKLDAPVLRIFAGRTLPEGYSSSQFYEWVIEGINACAAHGEQHGVMIVLQNHNELLKTAGEVLELRKKITSDWFGLNVDIGSLRSGDPYEEIALLAPYACTWQIKENVYRNGKAEKTDLNKIVMILKEAGYRGYIPLETLGQGDPKDKLSRFINEAREALG